MRGVELAQHIIGQSPQIATGADERQKRGVAIADFAPVDAVEFLVVEVLLQIGPGLVKHLLELRSQRPAEGEFELHRLGLILTQVQLQHLAAAQEIMLPVAGDQVVRAAGPGGFDGFGLRILKGTQNGFKQPRLPFFLIAAVEYDLLVVVLDNRNTALVAEGGADLLDAFHDPFRLDHGHRVLFLFLFVKQLRVAGRTEGFLHPAQG